MKFFSTFIFLLALGLFHSSNTSAQFIFNQKNIRQVIQIEDSLKSTALGIQEKVAWSNYFADENGERIYYPLCYRRENDSLLSGCKVEYFYAGKDSNIAAVIYNWNIFNDSNELKTSGSDLHMGFEKRSEFVNKYKSLVTYFNSIAGKPEFSDELNQSIDKNFSGETLWKDSVKTITLIVTYVPAGSIPYPDGKLSLNLKIEWNSLLPYILMYSKENPSYINLSIMPEQMPEYKGGTNSLVQFLKSNLNYPKSSKRKGIQGKVVISFIIDYEGNVRKANVVQGINEECDNEALRVLNLTSGNWNPAKSKGKNISTMTSLPINFDIH